MNRYFYHACASWAAFVCVIALSGCQSLPAVPEHKYYRLLTTPVAATPAQHILLSGELAIHPLHADGLYSERAIVFSDELQQRQLRQYHYQYWLYPPAQLLQEHLADRLRHAGVAPAVRADEHSAEASYAVSGRIVRFEKIIAADQDKASVALELRLEKKGRLLWQKTYVASEAVPGSDMPRFVAAMETALNRIYGDFLNDLRQARLN